LSQPIQHSLADTTHYYSKPK